MLLASLSVPEVQRQHHTRRHGAPCCRQHGCARLLRGPFGHAHCPAAQNWGASLPPARPGRVLVPQTPEDVAHAVVVAAAAGRRVRAVGKGHTWTPVFFDGDGTLRTGSDAKAVHLNAERTGSCLECMQP